MKKPLTFICRQKFKFILHVFLEILQRCWKLNVLGSMGMPRHTKPLNFGIHLQEKIQLHPHTFKEILQRYTNLLLKIHKPPILGTQNDSINLEKTLMFMWMPKINFIIHFFFEILLFKESYNLIGWQHCGP